MAALSPHSHKAPEQASLAKSGAPAGAASGPFYWESSCPDTFPQKGPGRGGERGRYFFQSSHIQSPFHKTRRPPKASKSNQTLMSKLFKHKEGF